jgi:hypothetical protein
MTILEVNNVETLSTDALHGTEQLVSRELAIPAVQNLIRVIHNDIKEIKSMMATARLAVTNLKDTITTLKVTQDTHIQHKHTAFATAVPTSEWPL